MTQQLGGKVVTIGISAKAKLAGVLTTSLGALSGIGITYLVTGSLDKAALAGALTGLASGLIAFIGAFIGEPGDVQVEEPVASDDLLSDEAHEKLK